MTFRLKFSEESAAQLRHLKQEPGQKAPYKAVLKTLGFMETNLKHPGLQTHEHSTLSRTYGKKVFESYAQNRTPGAYRIFWIYGPGRGELTIVAIVPHPE
ncbi:MAG: hypothetical protein M5U26_23255 [Planctomycetota bacterium]|nr:hypothetical protein [Planctomycetota bacterium]